MALVVGPERELWPGDFNVDIATVGAAGGLHGEEKSFHQISAVWGVRSGNIGTSCSAPRCTNHMSELTHREALFIS